MQWRALAPAGVSGVAGAPGADGDAAHARAVRSRSGALRAVFAAGRRIAAGLFEEPHHRRNHEPADATGRRGRCGGLARAHVQRRQDQPHGKPRGAACGAAQPQQSSGDGRRRGRDAEGECRHRADGRVRRTGAQRRVARLHRRAHHRRGQHRHRRLRPRPADGGAGAEALPPSAPEAAFHFQRRRRPCEGNAGGAESGDDAVHRVVENLHHAGNHDQRAHRARLVSGAGAGGTAHREAFRGGVDQPRRGDGIRHRPRQHVRILGLGGRALFAVVGDRPVDRAGGGRRSASSNCWKARTRWTSTSAMRRWRRTCR